MNAKNKVISEIKPDVAWQNAAEPSCFQKQIILFFCKNKDTYCLKYN